MRRNGLRIAAVTGFGMLAMANAVYAASAQTIPTPVPFGENIVVENPSVTLIDAVNTAEKAYKAKSTSARLRYGHRAPVWQVRLTKEDGERLLVWIDAKDGSIMAANTYGKDRGHRRGFHCDDRDEDGHRGGWHDDCRGPGCRD